MEQVKDLYKAEMMKEYNEQMKGNGPCIHQVLKYKDNMRFLQNKMRTIREIENKVDKEIVFKLWF
jgi:hypothetical protein